MFILGWTIFSVWAISSLATKYPNLFLPNRYHNNTSREILSKQENISISQKSIEAVTQIQESVKKNVLNLIN